MSNKTLFFSLVSSAGQFGSARLLIESLRSFGGPMAEAPVWLFSPASYRPSAGALRQLDIQGLTLEIPEPLGQYPFAAKVCACAQAEALAAPEVQTLVWLNPECVILKPPLLLELGPAHDIALRPVHIRNVGLPAGAPLDAFWSRIYEALGLEEVHATVATFVGGEQIRAYYNSHLLAVNPARGLFRQWLGHFAGLVSDQPFQAGACHDGLHRIFLHQAVLSALLTARVAPARIRLLPPDYSYPYNLHASVPEARRARTLNELTCVVWEERSPDPRVVDDIEIVEPLRSWLAARF